MSNGTPLKFDMVGRTDSKGDEYFFTRPNAPCLVDLSKVVIFIHPYDEGDKSGAELVIKNYTPNSNKRRSTNKSSGANGRKAT